MITDKIDLSKWGYIFWDTLVNGDNFSAYNTRLLQCSLFDERFVELPLQLILLYEDKNIK